MGKPKGRDDAGHPDWLRRHDEYDEYDVEDLAVRQYDLMEQQLRFACELTKPLLLAARKRVELRRDFDPGYTDGPKSKAEARRPAQ